MSETEHLWEYVTTLTRAVMQLSGAVVQLANDPKILARLQPLHDELQAAAKIHAEHCRGTVERLGPSQALREMAEGLQARQQERSYD